MAVAGLGIFVNGATALLFMRGRDTVQGIPSRFIAEMKLHEVRALVDPREKLKALRAAAAARAPVGDPIA